MLHAQLFEQQPALAFLPLFVVGLVAHFFIRARSADASRAVEVEAGQVRPLLLREDKAADDAPRSQPQPHPLHHAPPLDLALVDDCDNDSSSSIYSSPKEDEDEDGYDDQDGDRDWVSGDAIYEVYDEGELDPELFLELQQAGDDDSGGRQSAAASLQDNGDGARQSWSGRSSDYNDPSEATGSWYDEE